MYKSPITKIAEDTYRDIAKKEDGALVATVEHAVGFKVDRNELIKALQYDRNSYDRGYNDAIRENLWISAKQAVPGAFIQSVPVVVKYPPDDDLRITYGWYDTEQQIWLFPRRTMDDEVLFWLRFPEFPQKEKE